MSKTKILIIDDEVEFASTLCQRLRLRGLDASDVHSGSEGLVQAVAEQPEVVILDLKMPDVNGLDILTEIKTQAPRVEVIMLTGHGSSASGIKAMEQGAFDYIIKPVDLGELMKKITQAAEQRG
ncbi:response regulator [Desulfogranum mediterraneum]|uniref:response regulator n=1 Tax=Desulfogranum mediterraneum TaxID=160661 RepID=UPI00041236F6|nr:response regulator [Desulfogranum mediterraneum]